MIFQIQQETPMVIGRLTDPRTINYIPPNQRDTQWDKIKDVKDPFGEPQSNEFGFWFNYFWAEAVALSSLTHAQKVKLSEMYFSVFQDAPHAGTLRADFATKSPQFKENVLRQLLLIGFRRVALEAPKTVPRVPGGRVIAPAPLTAVDAAELNLTQLEVKGNHWPIAYRSDSRSYDEVKAHGGFTARARSQNSPIYKAYGLNQPWHPFNNPVYGNSLWLRLGATNKDNCLHTVISTGPSFAKITHFPILSDYVLVFLAKSASGQFLALKPLDEWTDADAQLALSDRNRVRAVRNSAGAVQYLEKENHVHVFHLCGVKGYNTEAHFSGSDKFPERGIEQVPVSHLLADLAFVQRYWYKEAKEKIELYQIEFAPIRWVPSESVVDFLLGEDGRLRLHAMIMKQIEEAQRREDVVGEKMLFDRYLREAATKLTMRERGQVEARLKEYLRANPPQPAAKGLSLIQANAARNAAVLAERNAVKLGLPGLSTKIDAVDKSDWSQIQKDAKP
jgi:hypothetical protein